MSDRPCPECAQPVAPHQTLCPACRAPVPSEAGPVGTASSTIAIGAPPPRQAGASPPPPPPTATVAPAPPPASVPPAAPSPPPAFPRPVAPLDATAVGTGPTWGSAATAAAAPVPTPAAGTIGVPGAAVLDERGNLPGGLLGLVAAVLVVAGVFLPWMSVEGRDVSGWSASDDSRILLAVAAVVTVVAALLVGGARSLVLRLLLAVAGLVTLGLGAFDVVDVGAVDRFDTSLGVGLILVLAGGAVALLAAILTRHRRFR